MLGALHDYEDVLTTDSMMVLDKYMLHKLHKYSQSVSSLVHVSVSQISSIVFQLRIRGEALYF